MDVTATEKLTLEQKEHKETQNGVVFYLEQSSPSIALKLVQDAPLSPPNKIDLYQFITDWLVNEEDLHKRTFSAAYKYYPELLVWLVQNESLNAKLYANMFRCLDKNFICAYLNEILYDFIEKDQYDITEQIFGVFNKYERIKILEGFWEYLTDLKYPYLKETLVRFLIPNIGENFPLADRVSPSYQKEYPKDWNELFAWCDGIKDQGKRELYQGRILSLLMQSDEVVILIRYLEEDHGKEYRKKIDDFFAQMTSFYNTERSVIFFKNSLKEPLLTEFLRFLRAKESSE